MQRREDKRSLPGFNSCHSQKRVSSSLRLSFILSRSSTCQMETGSSLNHTTPTDLNNHRHCDYGGAIIPEHITGQQHYSKNGRKKNKVRLNDQLIPKPTDINIVEKMTKTATPKEHPYSSHISRFAMFPSFRTPNDPETGVRAAFQPYLSPLIPSSAPDVTLLSKTFGGPCRHELLETPIKTRKKAITWTGEHIFLDHTQPLKGENQVFFLTPPKTVVPNPKLRECDFSLSERTSNILKNLERKLWVTSYQMHYTGSGPANPLTIDDLTEKISGLTGINSRTAPLREKSYPGFVHSKPKQVYRRRQERSTYSPAAAELLNPSSALRSGTATATITQHRPQEITAKHNEAQDSNLNSTGYPEAMNAELSSQEVSHQQHTECKSSAYEGRYGENCKVQFDDSPAQASMSQSSQEVNTAWIPDKERPLDLYNCLLSQGEINDGREKILTESCDEPSNKTQYFKVGRNRSSHGQSVLAKDKAHIDADFLSRAASEPGKPASVRKLSHSISSPSILPSHPTLPGIHPADRVNAALSLLQNSFSKSETHRNFNSSIICRAVNRRDNVVTGKKHDFYGINCYYLHG